MKLSLLLLFAFAFSTAAVASKLSIELDENDLSQMPASDLVYQGAQIDELEAFELKKSGVDLSLLNPIQTTLYTNSKQSISNERILDYPEKVKVNFKSFKSSPREIFRAQVIDPKSDKQFVITASLDNHTNVLRSGLLRLLGYDLDSPRFYKEMEINFDTESEKEKFIELVGEETLTKRDKWFYKNNSKTQLTLKGFTLEPAELRNVNIHLPVMVRSRQVDRRSFRGLIALYALTDFTQKVNDIPWKIGRSFNNSLILNHPYAGEFKNTTYDDMKWMLRKINALSKNELAQAMSHSKYPEDINALLLEKLSSRIKYLGAYFNLKSELTINTEVTLDNVLAGRLIRGDYDDYVVEFYEKDPDNPYRFSEIFRLFKTQIIFSSLSGILHTAIQRFVPGIYTTDAAESVQQQIQEYRQDNPGNNGVLPLSAYSSPLASGRVFANRNVVFGQYLGNTAPIQLVDSIGAEASLGVYTSIAGITDNIMPGLTANVSLGRSYVHVRAMPDLRTASRQNIKRLFVPGLMKKLGRVISDEFDCSVPNKAYVEKSELNDETIYYIKYDKKLSDGKEQALKLRAELIDQGISPAIILILVIDREELCTTEIATTRSESLKKFLKEFAKNETFIINDTLRLTGSLNAPIPVAVVPGMTVSIGTDHSVTKLKSVMLKRTDYGIEITIARQKDRRHGHKEGLNYFIEILSHANTFTRGNLISNVYKIDLDDLTTEKEEIALKALREFLVSNNHETLKDNYAPTELDHDIWARLRVWKLLWFRSEKMKMDHTVDIIVPNKEGQEFSLDQRTRKLFSTFVIKRSGSDFQTFVDRTIQSFWGFISIGSSNGDPGQSFMGNGKKVSVTTESELTKTFPLSPISRIEYVWTGWRKKTKRLEKYFTAIEDIYKPFLSGDLIDRSLFNGSDKLLSYDIKNTLIIYPTAFDKIEKSLLETSETVAINTLFRMYGEENWKNFCQRAIEFFGENGPQTYSGEDKYYSCVPASVKDVLKLRGNFPTDRIKKTKAINLLYLNLFKNFEPSSILVWLGKKHFFSSSRITGFRTNHSKGFIEYISDTVGEYNTTEGTGIFDRIGAHLGISPFELRAMSYTPGL